MNSFLLNNVLQIVQMLFHTNILQPTLNAVYENSLQAHNVEATLI